MNNKLTLTLIVRLLLVMLFSGLSVFCFLRGFYWTSIVAVGIAIAGVISTLVLIHKCLTTIKLQLLSLDSELNSSSTQPARSTANKRHDYLQDIGSATLAIAQRFQALQQHHELSKAVHSLALDNLSSPVIAFNEHGNILSINHAMLKLNQPSLTFTPRHTRLLSPRLRQLFDAVISSPRDHLHDWQQHNTVVRFSAWYNVMNTHQGKLFTICFTDISHALEKQEVASWKKLLTIITHEVGNSVAPISSLSQTALNLVQQQGADIRLGEMLQLILNRSKWLTDYTESYRRFSVKQQAQPEYLNLPTLIETTLQLFQSTFAENHIQLNFNSPPHAQVYVDRNRTSQALINIIKNAVQALTTQAEPRLSVELVVQQYIVVNISDNGSGIEAQDLPNIFMPFFTRKASGSGLGLAVARENVLLCGGQISCHSEPQQGTTLTLSWPLAEQDKKLSP